jgi:hypothetical protein
MVGGRKATSERAQRIRRAWSCLLVLREAAPYNSTKANNFSNKLLQWDIHISHKKAAVGMHGDVRYSPMLSGYTGPQGCIPTITSLGAKPHIELHHGCGPWCGPPWCGPCGAVCVHAPVPGGDPRWAIREPFRGLYTVEPLGCTGAQGIGQPVDCVCTAGFQASPNATPEYHLGVWKPEGRKHTHGRPHLSTGTRQQATANPGKLSRQDSSQFRSLTYYGSWLSLLSQRAASSLPLALLNATAGRELMKAFHTSHCTDGATPESKCWLYVYTAGTHWLLKQTCVPAEHVVPAA